MSLGFSKDEQLKRYREREAEKKAKRMGKGRFGEVQAGIELAEVFGGGYTLNHQGREGGGTFNPDLIVKGMPGWAWEVKNTQNLSLPEWLDKLEADNGPKRGLIFHRGGKRYAVLEVPILGVFIQDGAEALGYVLERIQR